MRFVLGGIVSLAVLAVAPAAHADQRYASPTGAGASCTQGSPCTLTAAISGAEDGDEVIVGSGSYTLPAPVTVPEGTDDVDIHGDFAGPMPKVSGGSSGVQPIKLLGLRERLRYLEITSTASGVQVGANCYRENDLERLRINVSGAESTGLYVSQNCILHDSVVRASGTSARAISGIGTATHAAYLRNVTALATGPGSIAIANENIYPEAGSYVLDVQNTIAIGEGTDLFTTIGSSGEAGDIAVSHSNFDSFEAMPGSTVSQGPGNQSQPPQFVNAAGGDYHEAPGSPTIDAGSTDRIGTLDAGSGPRLLGSAPDIGAFEFAPAALPPVDLLPTPVPGRLESLSLSPKVFAARGAGEAVVSKKRKAPAGTTVSYTLSAPGQVTFTVEKVTRGRKSGKKCVKQTKANKGKKACESVRPLNGSFAHTGIAGANSFKFSGRVGGRALAPGSYRLTGTAGGATVRAPFRVVK